MSDVPSESPQPPSKRQIYALKLPAAGSHADRLLRHLAAQPGGRIHGTSGYEPYAEADLVRLGWANRIVFGPDKGIWLLSGVKQRLSTITGRDRYNVRPNTKAEEEWLRNHGSSPVAVSLDRPKRTRTTRPSGPKRPNASVSTLTSERINVVLRPLAAAGGRMVMDRRRIAADMNARMSTVTSILRQLEDKGYLRRSGPFSCRLLIITAAGRSWVDDHSTAAHLSARNERSGSTG
jgi:hypothetical protein